MGRSGSGCGRTSADGRHGRRPAQTGARRRRSPARATSTYNTPKSPRTGTARGVARTTGAARAGGEAAHRRAMRQATAATLSRDGETSGTSNTS
ncbi:hypothetical protein BURMUCF1_A1190 [Burkholderia multivorans ATCC BAA-247]|nr:hypothetical protein BURMUCF1_A1190 [Burkholderia multivorans ATCC BAA-247]